MARLALSFVTCFLLLQPVAISQDTSEQRVAGSDARIDGSWKFETEPYREGVCMLSGTMLIRPSSVAPEHYECAFTAIEECQNEDRWVVEQTCQAARVDNRLSIQSDIQSFLEADGLTTNYQTDNFILQIESGRLMEGYLVSAISAPVEFRRALDAVS